MRKGGVEFSRTGSVFALVLVGVLLGLAPRASHAQECVTEFKDQTAGLVADNGTVCQTAVGNKCTFELALCVNLPEEGCTPQSLSKKVRASGHCGPVGKVNVRPNGTSSACGAFAGVKVRTRNHGRNAGKCRLRAKGGTDLDKIDLLCEPVGTACPGGTTTTTTSLPGTTTTVSATTTTHPSTTATVATTTSTTVATTTSTTATTTTSTTVTTITVTTTTTSTSSTTITTASTTTSTTVTTTTIPLSLKFTNTPGTTSCGGAGLSPAPAAPFTGELDSDTACSTKTNDLGRGCLYIGGGNAKAIPPGAVPSGATNYLDVSGSNLVASNGTGSLDCTKAAGPGKYCLNNDTLNACTNDAGCGGYTGACHGVANCYFGPPLEFPNPILTSLTTCVQNVIQTDAAGMGNPSTGDSTVSLPLSSWVYVTGNITSPCPKCAGTCTYGANVGGACLSGGSTGSSQDCPPTRGGGAFQAPLSVTLNPLTTGTSTLVGASGAFCPNQKTAGAFAVTSSQCIKTVGNAAGDLTDGVPHSGAILASAFCIPTTTNSTIDGVADLPGPGLTSLPGTAQLVPTP